MNQRTMWIYVVAAVAALGFAWKSAHTVEEKKGGPSSVTLLDAGADSVKTLAYRWDKGSTTTTFAGAKAARRAVVVVDRELPAKKDPKEKDKKDDAVDAGVPEALVEPAVREQGTIPGGKGVLAAATALEPLTTKRTLGVVDDARLLAMGLSPAVRFLDVTTSTGQQLHLEIGESSYGAQGRYARVVGDKAVHLIDGAVINGLEGGLDTLLEKRLLLAELDQIRGFDVVAGGAGAEQRGSFLHVDKDQPSTRYWASKDAPTTKREAVGKLLTTLRNLRGSALAGKDVVAGAVVVRFVVDVDGSAQQIDVLERADGSGQLAKVGDFTWTLSPTSGKEIVDDATTALAE